MGTTSDKLTYLNTTKEQLKTKINSLGGSITASTPFRDYVDALDDISGGGGYPPDWSLIGYSDTPPAITNGFNYAKEIYDNWDNTTTMFDFKAYTKLVMFPLIDTSNVNYMYQGLQNVPGLISMPLINTEKVTDMGSLFAGCRALVDVPVLATSRLSSWGFNNTFSNCLSLSDESLNNILRMCINATGVTGGYKSLRMLGLTNAQWTRCQSLSNYQEFLDAGWEPGF